MNANGALGLWKILLLAQLREQPARFLVTVLALALGVALGASVYLVNTSALNEFGLATKRMVGEADIVIRGPREGFAEKVYVDLARNPSVAALSPVLELEVALAGRNERSKCSDSIHSKLQRCSRRSLPISAMASSSFSPPTEFT